MELLWNFPHSKMSKMEVKMELELEAFRCSFIILQKPILANRLFSLFAELLRIVDEFSYCPVSFFCIQRG